jgi:hypothetical protein
LLLSTKHPAIHPVGGHGRALDGISDRIWRNDTGGLFKASLLFSLVEEDGSIGSVQSFLRRKCHARSRRSPVKFDQGTDPGVNGRRELRGRRVEVDLTLHFHGGVDAWFL